MKTRPDNSYKEPELAKQTRTNENCKMAEEVKIKLNGLLNRIKNGTPAFESELDFILLGLKDEGERSEVKKAITTSIPITKVLTEDQLQEVIIKIQKFC